MKLIKNFYTWLMLGVVALSGGLLASCNDDIPAASYYTFTGEYMGDYLNSHEEYSDFAEIVKRASKSTRGVNIMDLVSCYGQFTCFAPTNAAVQAYLQKNNYAGVEDIPYDICDTIARTHFVNGMVYNTFDLMGLSTLSKVNMNGYYLPVQDTVMVDGNGERTPTFYIGKCGFIQMTHSNDSVQNGIVHCIDCMLPGTPGAVTDVMHENPSISLFSDAMELTGITETISLKVKDESWNPDLYEDRSVYSGAQWDYCHIPSKKDYGFTVFACPNKVLEQRYGITDMQGLYDYGRQIYGGEELDVNDPANAKKLKDPNNPLYKLIAYNIMDRKSTYDHLTTICTIETTVINPTEWYSTMLPLSTIKVEQLTVSRFVGVGPHDVRKDLYLNRGDMSRGYTEPGIHVDRDVEGDYDNRFLNGFYYTTDGLADYGEVTKRDIFNTRMRIDMYDFFPEMASNDLRSEVTNTSINDSNNPNSPAPNYWFPNGYLDNVKINDDGIFLYQSPHNTYWSYEGDEFNLASDVNSYDVTFNLPSVPSGTYQIRLGFADMPTRGICQFYLDGTPQGIPFDMRSDNFETRTGYFALENSGYGKEELEAAKKNMHNLGWYHGPKGVFNFGVEGTKDGANAAKNKFCNNARTVRFVLCTATLDEKIQHTVRIKSVWAVGTALVMIDYFELVPKGVYGVEGEGKAEDDN